MNTLLTGFVDELIKIGAFGQQTKRDDAYDADTEKTMSDSQGSGAIAGKNRLDPRQPKPVARGRVAPTPETTPMGMVNPNIPTSGQA
jgi:hypothetical protein